MYTAAVLTPLSVNLLKWIVRATIKLEEAGFLFETIRGDPLPHHMTINLGVIDRKLNPLIVLETKSELQINCINYDLMLGVCAIPVLNAVSYLTESSPTPINTINEVPHITLCLKTGVAPRKSNDMFKSGNENMKVLVLDQTYTLEATILEVE